MCAFDGSEAYFKEFCLQEFYVVMGNLCAKRSLAILVDDDMFVEDVVPSELNCLYIYTYICDLFLFPFFSSMCL